MDYTYLDYFNYYLKEYINELINTFPETQQPLLANYRLLLEGRDDKNDLYVKCFYTKINNFLTQIAKRDNTLFDTQGKIFIEGIDLYNIWNNTSATDQTRIAIWKYLQILMILGRKIIPNHKEIVELLYKVSNGDVNIPSKVEKTLSSIDADADTAETSTGVFGLGDIASSLGGLSSIANGMGLGKLAESFIGGSGGSGDAGGDGGGGVGGLGNLVSSITNMFKNPEFTNAMSQLSQSFNMPSTPSSEQQTHDTEQTRTPSSSPQYTSNSEQSTTPLVSAMSEQLSSAKPSQLATPDTATSATSATPETHQPLFNNPLFNDLAKELTDTFNFDEMEKDGKPQNIGDALGKFMTGNNPAKLMSLVGKFGNKLQQEVKNGSINPAELLKQTMGAMGNSIDTYNMQLTMANMMRQMSGAGGGGGGGGASGASGGGASGGGAGGGGAGGGGGGASGDRSTQQSTKPQTTRDRLRAKLDKKTQ